MGIDLKHSSQHNAIERYYCYGELAQKKLVKFSDEHELCQSLTSCGQLTKIFANKRKCDEENFNVSEKIRSDFLKISLDLLAKQWFHRQDLRKEEILYLIDEIVPATVLACDALLNMLEAENMNFDDPQFNPLSFLGSWLLRHNPRRHPFILRKEYGRTCRIGYYQVKQILYGYRLPELENCKMTAINLFQEHVQQEVIDKMEQERRHSLLSNEFAAWNNNYHGTISTDIVFNVFKYVAHILNERYDELPFHQIRRLDEAIQRNIYTFFNVKQFIEFTKRLLKWHPKMMFDEILAIIRLCRNMHESSLIVHQLTEYLKTIFTDLDSMNIKLIDRQSMQERAVKIFSEVSFNRTIRNPLMIPMDSRVDDDRYYLENFLLIEDSLKQPRGLSVHMDKEISVRQLSNSAGSEVSYHTQTVTENLDKDRRSNFKTYVKRPLDVKNISGCYLRKSLDASYVKDSNWNLLERNEKYLDFHAFHTFITSLMEANVLVNNIQKFCEKLINEHPLNPELTLESLKEQRENIQRDRLIYKTYEIFKSWDRTNSGKIYADDIFNILSKYDDEKNNYIIAKVQEIHCSSQKITVNKIEFSSLLIDYYTLHTWNDDMVFLTRFIYQKLKQTYEENVKLSSRREWLRSLLLLSHQHNCTTKDIANRTFDIILQNSVNQKESTLRNYSVTIYYLLPRVGSDIGLRVIAATKPDDEYCEGKIITPEDSTLMFGCIESSKIILKTNTANDKTIFHWIPDRDSINGCIAYVPILNCDTQAVGIMVVDTFRDRYPEDKFTKEELDFFQMFANAFDTAYNQLKRNLQFLFAVKNFVNHMFHKYRSIKGINFYEVHPQNISKDKSNECPFSLKRLFHCDGTACLLDQSLEESWKEQELFLSDSIFREGMFRSVRDGITVISPNALDIDIYQPLMADKKETSHLFQFVVDAQILSIENIFTMKDNIFRLDFVRYNNRIQRFLECIRDGSTDSVAFIKYKLEKDSQLDIMELVYYKIIVKDIILVLKHFVVNKVNDSTWQEKQQIQPGINEICQTLLNRDVDQENVSKKSGTSIEVKINIITEEFVDQILSYDPTENILTLDQINDIIQSISLIEKQNFYEELLLDWIYITLQANQSLLSIHKRDTIGNID
ncbi:hypothetical protein SNEBB_001355 [Seison nebaliae]|nr:hypothetical protein SNEBB_001355 [Seison nebaliae]